MSVHDITICNTSVHLSCMGELWQSKPDVQRHLYVYIVAYQIQFLTLNATFILMKFRN